MGHIHVTSNPYLAGLGHAHSLASARPRPKGHRSCAGIIASSPLAVASAKRRVGAESPKAKGLARRCAGPMPNRMALGLR